MLRLLLGMLPFFALSAFDATASDDDDEETTDSTDDSDPEEERINAEAQKRLNSILGNEKKRLASTLREEIRKELEDEAARKASEEAEEFRPLYETEKAKREQAEQEAQSVEAAWRSKLVRSEIKVQAAQQKFVDADVAQKLIDLEAVDYDDNGEPTNIEELVKSLATEHPYLIQDEKTPVKPVENSRANGKPAGRDAIKNKYLRQAGVAPRES